MAQTPIVTKEGLTYYDNKIKSILSGKEELGAAEEALSSSKQYTDTELQDFASEVNASLTVLGQEIDGKAPATHNHKISDVTNLQNTLDSKANKSELPTDLVVNVTTENGDWTASYTYTQILQAFMDGRTVYTNVNFDGIYYMLPFVMGGDETLVFALQFGNILYGCQIASDDSVLTMMEELTPETFGAVDAGEFNSFKTTATNHINNKSNPHGVTKSQIGLGNVNNTSDANKPVSTAQATAIADAKKAGTDAQATADEAKDAISDHTSNKSNPHSVTKSQVGLGNVDNTSDANKPVSTAQATAIADAKKAGTDAQSAIDAHEALTNNPHGVTAAQVGLGNVPNVSTNNQKPTFTAASSLSALTSGNTLSVQFGKIAKAITDLISHLANKSNPHGVTAAQVGADPVGSAAAVQTNLNTLNDEFDDHTENADIHFTAAERTKLSGIATGANKYTHPNSGVTAGTYKSVTVNAAGHVTGGSNPTTLAGYGITDAEAKGTATSTVGTHNTSNSAHNDIRLLISDLTTKVNNFLDVDDTTTDQLSELIALIQANASDIESITSGKINVADIVNNLTTNSSSKVLSAAQGVALKALIDALDSDKVDKVSGKGLSTNDYTTTEKNKLSGIASGAEVNQNAFSNIKVGTTTVVADAKTDTVEFVGSNVTITPDATNDKITFDVASGTTSAAGIVKLSNSTSSTSTSLAATPKAVKSAYDLANTAKTNAETAQTTADSASDAAAAAQSTADTATTNLSSHTGNTSNPHSVTKAQVGLGNVPNVTTNNQTPTYTVASSNAELKSGETMTTAFGKIAKAVSSLIAHLSNTSNPHSVTKSQVGLGNVDNTADANKTVKAAGTATTATTLSGLTATVTELNILDGVTATTAELNYVDGVTSNIQTQLNGKAASSHGTHVTYSTTAPAANGTASAGSAANVSRGDHVHPLQTAVSGNAGTATKLQTARTITLSGDASGSVSFDGSENKTLTVTVADDSHNHVISNVDGLQTALDGKSNTGHTHGIADVTNLQTTLDSLQSQIDEASSSAGGAFDFDAYANAAGYAYSYDKSTMTETITYGGSTFATRTNVKDTDKWTITTVCKSMGVNNTKIWTKTTSGWTAS